MQTDNALSLTVLEGFYGAEWGWQKRRQLIAHLSDKGQRLFPGLKPYAPTLTHAFQAYCYAPKSNKSLRENWQLPFSDDTYQSIKCLSSEASSHNIGFSLGFSPVSCITDWQASRTSTEALLLARLKEFASLNITALGIFFDDMQGDSDQLAKTQTEIVSFIRSSLPGVQLFFCHTYYSNDPVLETLFGQMPDNYWPYLGGNIDHEVSFFWTGEKVISSEYHDADVAAVAQVFQRPLTLWDNSGVNDGRLTSPYLPLDKITTVQSLHAIHSITGMWLNPSNAYSVAMLQIMRSQYGLSAEQMFDLLSIAESAFISKYFNVFTRTGFDALTPAKINQIQLELKQVPIITPWFNLFKEDVLLWLGGHFVFDPNCLT